MPGWIVPPPKPPTKTAADFATERRRKVRWLEEQGLLKSARIKAALLRVPREEFIPSEYRDYAYEEVPLPLPGAAAECEPFEAEIAALEAALEATSTVAARRVRVYTDCDALVSLWLQRRQDPRLRRVRYLARRLRRFELRSLPRRHNQVVHRLARAGASRLNLHDS
jgi:hypothetical protein